MINKSTSIKTCFFVLLLVLSVLTSCKKHYASSIIIPVGTYKGTLGYSGSLIYPGLLINITLVLSGQNYTYYTDPNQQSGSNGTYLISGQKIYFTPSANSTNGPSGVYDATIQTGNLVLNQTENDIIENIYITKQ